MKAVEEIAAKLVAAVENVAPKTWELLVRAEFVESLVYMMVAVLVVALAAVVVRKLVLLGAKQEKWDKSDYWIPAGFIAVFAAGFFVAVTMMNLPSVLAPEAVTAKQIVKGALR